MLQVFTLENRRLENFLERHKAYYAYSGEIEVDRFLREILQKANEFVPSEAGSIRSPREPFNLTSKGWPGATVDQPLVPAGSSRPEVGVAAEIPETNRAPPVARTLN